MQTGLEHTFELLMGSVAAVFGFFGKRTLSNYDRRIRDSEIKHDKILWALNKIDKKVVEIDTKLNFKDEI